MRSTLCIAAPKPSQTSVQGAPTAVKIDASSAAWRTAGAPSACRKLPAAPAQISHAFGLTHWNAAASKNPTDRRRAAVAPRPAVAIF